MTISYILYLHLLNRPVRVPPTQPGPGGSTPLTSPLIGHAYHASLVPQANLCPLICIVFCCFLRLLCSAFCYRGICGLRELLSSRWLHSEYVQPSTE